ncbi:MAG: class IV adenylate cyclase [Candidatus Paceibacterota bacterium]|jgi:adenylate cyclase class 2
MQEYELKFLEVNVKELEKKLLSIGAEKVGEYDLDRINFDYPDFRLRKIHAWLRLRTDGKETTLTYKQNIKGDSIDGRTKNIGCKEIEIKIDNFENGKVLLETLGFIPSIFENNKRIKYKKDDVIYDIDSWPFIPTYLEIETISYEKAKEVAREIGLDGEQGVIGSAGSIYKMYGYDIDDYSSITFEGMIKK